MEKTFAIIKPNSIQEGLIGKILSLIEQADIRITQMRMESLTKERAEGFYAEHKERPFFGSLVTFMTSGPVILMALEGEKVIEQWRNLMGATNPEEAAPGTIRKLFANSIEANCVHGSDSPASAERELNYFFG